MSLEDIPSAFGTYFGITTASAQILLSIVVIFMVLLPVIYLTRETNGAITIYIMTFLLIQALLIGIGWLPYWIMIATVAMMTIAVAMIGSKAITGEG